MIDLENENLSYNEVRAIRANLEYDVQQLKNRTRMLQEEEQRALRQIAETKRKAAKIRQTMAENEAKMRL